MTPSWRRWICVLALASSGLAAAADPPTAMTAMTVEKLREAFSIPAGADVHYRAEDGTALSAGEFTRLMQAGSGVSLIKNPAKGTYTLQLEKKTAHAAPAPITKLPPIDAVVLDGRRVRSTDLAGKPTLLSFFFAECVPCIKEVPILNAFRRKHPDYNYLALTFDPPEVAKGFVKKFGLEWPVAANTLAYMNAADIKSYPTYVLLSETGAVLGADTGLDTASMANTAVGLKHFETWVDETRQRAAWRPLLDTRLSQFDVYLSYPGTVMADVVANKAPAGLEPIGLNPPRQTVFTVASEAGRPVLRISGEIYGCLATKQPFSNYHLRAKVKWGEKKWPPRLTEPRDSGILYHSRGDFGIDYWKSWALSQEFQVIEHGLGEYWTQATSAFDIRVDPKVPGAEAPKWNPRAPWMMFLAPNNHALAGSDQDKPGQWNALELLCIQGDCVHVVNGTVVMALKNARYRDGNRFIPMTGGKLQIQSEAAEVFYKDIEIRAIPAMPPEYSRYFK